MSLNYDTCEECGKEVVIPNSHRGDVACSDCKDNKNKSLAKKLTPRDLACFDEVSRVIGEYNAEYELGVVIGTQDVYDKHPLSGALSWNESAQGYEFWDKISNGENPYSRIDVIGQNGNDGEHYAEVDGKSTMLQDKEFLENYDKHQGAVKAMDDLHTASSYTDETPQKTPAYAFLEAGVNHMKDRASERDTGEERSMKSCVNAFNAMYADIIKDNDGNLTEELGWMFMVFLKASRAKGGDYRQDDYEDGAAYFALAGESSSIERKNAKQNK